MLGDRKKKIGKKIFIGLKNMVQGRNLGILEFNEKEFFTELEMIPYENIYIIFIKLFHFSKILRLLHTIFRTEDQEVNSNKLEKLTRISKDEIE